MLVGLAAAVQLDPPRHGVAVAAPIVRARALNQPSRRKPLIPSGAQAV
jgi:hypothetical protein